MPQQSCHLDLVTVNKCQCQCLLRIPFLYFAAAESGSRISQHYRFDLNDLQRGFIPLPKPAEKSAKGGLQYLAHNCASLYNDWLGVGCWVAGRMIGWQPCRNSDYSGVVTFVLLFLVVVVVVLALLSLHANCLLFSSGNDDACLQRPTQGTLGC